MVGELLRSAGCGHLWVATIDACKLTAILSGSLEVLLLHGRRLDVILVLSLQLLRLRAGLDSASATVEADVSVVHDSDVIDVDVGDVGSAIVADSGVVEEVTAAPFAACKPGSEVAEAVVNAAIEADVWAPISAMEPIKATIPAPVSGRPKIARRRCHDPGAGNPVVAFGTIVPVAWGPDIALAGADRLHVNGENRGGDANIDGELPKGRRRDCHQCSSNDQFACEIAKFRKIHSRSSIQSAVRPDNCQPMGRPHENTQGRG